VQRPRVDNHPAGSLVAAEEAGFLAAGYGMAPDPWQQLVLNAWLAQRPDGRLASSRVGLAVPRQNGKNGVLEIVELYKMVVQGRRVLHTAHEVKTAAKAFKRLLSFFDNPAHPEMMALVRSKRLVNGQEGIFLKNGGSIEFIARSKNSGRGFTVDDLVMDEAQELSEDSLAALLPTISSAPSKDPQQLVTGTPPSTVMNGDVFLRMRNDGVAGRTPRLAWLEWSAEPDCDPNDRELWAACNPSLGIRLNVETIEDERAAFDDATFMRERLGVWAASSSNGLISAEVWAALADTSPPKPSRLAFALDVSPDRKFAAVARAGMYPDGRTVHVAVSEHRSLESGTKWVSEWLRENVGRAPVVVDAASPAAALLPELQAARLRVITTSATDMARACGGLVDAVTEKTVRHFDQPGLNLALDSARTRTINAEAGTWGWARRSSDTDISSLVAVTLARYGLVTATRPEKTKTGGVLVL